MCVRKGYIVAIAELNGVIPESLSKHDYIVALIKWVCSLIY